MSDSLASQPRVVRSNIDSFLEDKDRRNQMLASKKMKEMTEEPELYTERHRKLGENYTTSKSRYINAKKCEKILSSRILTIRSIEYLIRPDITEFIQDSFIKFHLIPDNPSRELIRRLIIEFIMHDYPQTRLINQEQLNALVDRYFNDREYYSGGDITLEDANGQPVVAAPEGFEAHEAMYRIVLETSDPIEEL